MKENVEQTTIPQPRLLGFLSDHESKEKIISIQTEPEIIYFEETQDGINLNFDFIIKGLTKKKLVIRFIKVAVYDKEDKLITFRHLNHNGVWTPGIQTIGKYEVDGEEIFDIYNPFHKFPKGMPINYLRYMFTFSEPDNGNE